MSIISDKFTSVTNKISDIKTNLATEITNKGVETNPSSSFNDMITNISNIPTGGDTITPYTWTKPTDWPDIKPYVTNNNIVLLVSDRKSNTIRLKITASSMMAETGGLYEIDWGDGVVETDTYSTGLTHTYSGNGIPSADGLFNYYIVIIRPMGRYLRKFSVDSIGSTKITYEILWCIIGTDKLTDCTKMFFNSYVDLSLFERFEAQNLSSVTKMDSSFRDCKGLKSIEIRNLSSCTTFSYMCYSCRYLKELILENTSNVTEMSNAFSICYSLETIPLIDTSNVLYMTDTFNGCYQLKEIPLFNTSKLKKMDGTFSSCHSLKKIPQFDTSNVDYFFNTFYMCESLETIPLLNTDKATRLTWGYSYQLKDISITGGVFTNSTSPQIDFNNTNLTPECLNRLFETLPNVTNKTIKLTSCTGAYFCDTSIATNKGWTVTM